MMLANGINSRSRRRDIFDRTMKKILFYGHITKKWVGPIICGFNDLESCEIEILSNIKTGSLHDSDYFSENKVRIIDFRKVVFTKKQLFKTLFSEYLRDITNKPKWYSGISWENLKLRAWLNEKSYDVVNIHFLNIDNLSLIENLGPHVKLILSAWGSDIMFSDDLGIKRIYNVQMRALQRADLVTVGSLEMKQMILIKYGYKLSEKIKIANFGFEQKRANFLRGFSCSSQKINPKQLKILVGYSGAVKRLNQIEILQTLNSLPQPYKDKITLVWLLTYNHTHDFLTNKLMEEIETSPFNSEVYRDFLSDTQYLNVLSGVDIFINAPKSDLMNGTMLELLAMNKTVINGAWLPYGFLYRNGVKCHTIESLKELNSTIVTIIDGHEIEMNNKNIVLDLFDFDISFQKWKNLFTLIK